MGLKPLVTYLYYEPVFAGDHCWSTSKYSSSRVPFVNDDVILPAMFRQSTLENDHYEVFPSDLLWLVNVYIGLILRYLAMFKVISLRNNGGIDKSWFLFLLINWFQ